MLRSNCWYLSCSTKVIGGFTSAEISYNQSVPFVLSFADVSTASVIAFSTLGNR